MSANILSRNGPAVSEARVLRHAMIPASRANGPGLRAVVFFQGCTLGCKEYFNPTTHVFQGVEVARESRRGVGRGSSGTYPRGRNVFRRRANATSRQLADFNAKPAEQGASTERLRTALKIIDAVSQGRMLFIATSNSIASLPPELRRRFTLGTFFFDLPTKEERSAIWKIYIAKYCVSGARPEDEGWTGAEIKECCRKAYRLRISLQESAQYIVPVSRSAAEQIKALRQQASGKFLSASQPGVYQLQDAAVMPKAGRAFRNLETAE